MSYVNLDEIQTGPALAGSSLPPSMLGCLQHIPPHTSTHYQDEVGREHRS